MTSRTPQQFDIAAAPALKLALDGAIRERAGAFVLDLREVEFLDSSGLRLMPRARAVATALEPAG